MQTIAQMSWIMGDSQKRTQLFLTALFRPASILGVLVSFGVEPVGRGAGLGQPSGARG